jgi:hypothetical protein
MDTLDSVHLFHLVAMAKPSYITIYWLYINEQLRRIRCLLCIVPSAPLITTMLRSNTKNTATKEELVTSKSYKSLKIIDEASKNDRFNACKI